MKTPKYFVTIFSTVLCIHFAEVNNFVVRRINEGYGDLLPNRGNDDSQIIQRTWRGLGAGYSDKQTSKYHGSRPTVRHPTINVEKLYETLNKIDPDTLKFLAPNFTEEPHVPRTLGHDCCYNGGTCHVPFGSKSDDDRWCTCTPNFTGRLCELDVDECALPGICKLHEKCVNNYGGYTCTCSDKYVKEGDDCIPKTTCEEDPCLHGADCVDKDNGEILCLCRLGFIGRRCEIKIPECEDSSCSDDETCVSTPTGFRCLKGSPNI